MNGTKVYGFEEVQRRCNVHEDINHHLIESWIRSAKNLYRTAQLREERQQLEDAYVFYSRVYEICVNMIPSHRDYQAFKKSPASHEVFDEYNRFRNHLGDNMDNFVALRKTVRDSFRDKTGGKTAVNGPRPQDPTLKTKGDNLTPRVVNPNSHSIGSPSTKVKVQEVTLSPVLPMSTTIDASKVLEYIQTYPDLSLLFLDVRTRDEFESCRIDHSNVVNIDPLVCRTGANSQDIEDAFVVGPSEELSLFERRDQFDLLIIYDQRTESLNPSDSPQDNIHPDALYNLQSALWEKANWRKPLARSPVLLTGGLLAWKRAKGPVYTRRRDSQVGPITHADQRSSSGSTSLVLQQPYFDSADVSEKRIHRGTSIVESHAEVGYPRSVEEYIKGFSPQRSPNSGIKNEHAPLDNSRFVPRGPSTLMNRAVTKPSTLILSPQPVVSPKSSPYLESPDSATSSRRYGLPAYARQPSLGSQTQKQEISQTTYAYPSLTGSTSSQNPVSHVAAPTLSPEPDTVLPRNPHELILAEQENINLFATLIERLKAEPQGTILRDPQIQELHESISALRPKLARALGDTVGKYESLVETHSKLATAVKYYDQMLEARLASTYSRDPYTYDQPQSLNHARQEYSSHGNYYGQTTSFAPQNYTSNGQQHHNTSSQQYQPSYPPEGQYNIQQQEAQAKHQPPQEQQLPQQEVSLIDL